MNRIWHDGAIKTLPLWLTITMLNTSMLLGLVLWRQASQARDPQPPLAQLLIILWLAIALYMLAGNVRTRCQRLEMTLPIASKTLWRRHLAGVALAGSLVLAGSFGVLALHGLLLTRVGREQVLEVPYLSLVVPLLAGLLLATSLIDSVEPGLWKLRGRRSYWALVIGSLVGILVLLLLLHRWPWLATALCLALAAVVLRRTQRSLPAAFRLVPYIAAPASTETATAATTAQPVSRRQVYGALFNVLHSAPPWKQFTPWMLYFFVALMGFILAGGLNRWVDAEDLRFLYLPFGSYMLFAGIGILTYHLYRLDPLPVPRRTLFAVLTLPGLIIYCGAYTAGRLAVLTDPDPAPLVDYKVQELQVQVDLEQASAADSREPRIMVWVEVDQRFMGVTLDGEPPTLTAPWGESHEAWHQPLFRGASALMYNPYNTTEETTADFEALMASQAIERVYGTTILPEEIRDRYLVVEDSRVVGLQEGGFTLLEDYPGLQAPAAGPETPIYMVLVLVPWFLLVALFVRSFRATSSIRFIRGVYWAGLGVLLGALLLQVVLSLFGLFSPDAGRGFLDVSIRTLGASSFIELTTWVVSLVVIVASYRFALSQFERAEIPASPVNCSLVDWGKES